MASTLKLIYTTAKVRLGFLIMACALAGIAVSSGSGLSTLQVFTLGLGVLLASASAGAFNQLYERDLDAKMTRTRQRPFVTGRFDVDVYWYGGILFTLLIGLLAAALATNVLAAFFVFLGAFTYGVVYTVWLKRRTWMNIVVGGLAGSFSVLAGAAAVNSTLEPLPVLLAIVLFFWTPPHFWALALACRKDYAAAGVPMLPVVFSQELSTRTIFVHAVIVVVLSLLMVPLGMGWVFAAGAIVGGTYFIVSSWRLYQNPSVAQGWRTFAASIVQLALLLTTSIVDRMLMGS